MPGRSKRGMEALVAIYFLAAAPIAAAPAIVARRRGTGKAIAGLGTGAVCMAAAWYAALR